MIPLSIVRAPWPAVAGALLILCLAQASAQDTATPTTKDATTTAAKKDATTAAKKDDSDDAEIVLSPFEIRADRDVGYTAGSSLAGGRTDMPLKDIAAAVSVITREFIDDVGATNYQQMADWGVNSQPGYSALATNQFSYTVYTRGPYGSFPSRNYFLWYVNSDSYATERYEYARGPNGVLFGDGNIGGMVTIFTKQPRFNKPAYSLNVRGDTWGGYSVRADLNQPVNDRFAMRLNLLSVHDEYWRDRTPFRNRGVHLGTAYKLTNDLTFRAEGEIGRGRTARALSYYVDAASYWNGTTVNTGSATPSTSGTGIGRVSSSSYMVYAPGISQSSVSDWSTQYKTQGSGLAMFPRARSEMVNFPITPYRKFNLAPGNTWSELDFYNYNFYLEKRFTNDLFLQLATSHLSNRTTDQNSNNNYNTYVVDVNQYLPNGQPNPKYLKAYTESDLSRGTSDNRVDDFRALLAYRFHNKWVNANINGIIGSRMDRFNLYSETVYRTNGTSQNVRAAANTFRVRYYWEEAGKYNSPDEAPSFPGSGYTFGYIPTSITNQRKWIDYDQIASTFQFFNGRLTLLGGIRRDGFHMTQQNNITNATTGLPEMGATIIPAGAKNPTAVVGAKLRQNYDPISRNGGVVLFPLRWFGVYANYSETFSTPSSGAALLDGSAPPVSRSKGQDYGIKIVVDSRLDLRLNYYQSRQEDNLVSNINTTETDRIWNNIGRSDMAGLSWRDTQTLRLQGYEFEVTANPVRSLRLTYNLAFPKVTNVDSYPRFKAYVAQYLPTWQAGANDPTNTNANQIKTDISTVQTAIANLVTGATTNNTTKYTSNVYATYTVPSGLLKNVGFGLGANVRGKTKVGNTAASAYEYLYMDSYYVVASHVSYERRFGNIRAKFQINVSNLLNNDKLLTTAYADYRVGGLSSNPAVRLPSTFRYIDPRKITFTTNFSF